MVIDLRFLVGCFELHDDGAKSLHCIFEGGALCLSVDVHFVLSLFMFSVERHAPHYTKTRTRTDVDFTIKSGQDDIVRTGVSRNYFV